MITIQRSSTIPANKLLKKRERSITLWKKDVEKYRRCQPKGPPLPPTCNHSYSKFECSMLGQVEVEYFHRKFYYTRNKAQQDAFILRHCQGRSPKRKSSMVQKERKLTVEYFVPARERNVQVCKEAFIGILRVNKSRVNALLKTFYKMDVSKDNTGDDRSTSKPLGASKERGMENMKHRNELTNTISTNSENSTRRNVSFDSSDQSELEPHSISCSISFIETEVPEEKPIDHKNQIESGNDNNLSICLNLDGKPQSPFKRSPLKQTSDLTSDPPVDSEVFNISQKKHDSAETHPISRDTSSKSTNHCHETAVESTEQTAHNPRISFSGQTHVYESKKRRLRKLETIDGKENTHQKCIKKKNNVLNSKPEQKKKTILLQTKFEKNSFPKRKVNKFGQNIRFPLRTLY